MNRWVSAGLLVVCIACGEERPDPVDAGIRVDAGLPRADAGTIPNTIIRVMTVFDGDTVSLAAGSSVTTPDGRPMAGQHIRLLGVDAPEIAHPPNAAECWGDEAHAAARTMLNGADVTLDYDLESTAGCTPPIQSADAERCGLRDMYGRLLAYVTITRDGSVANASLIRQGHALSYRRFPHRQLALYNELESQAHSEQLGLWATCR